MSAFCKAPKPLPKTTLLDLLDTPSASQETVWSHYLGSRNTPRDFCPLSLVSLFSALYFIFSWLLVCSRSSQLHSRP